MVHSTGSVHPHGLHLLLPGSSTQIGSYTAPGRAMRKVIRLPGTGLPILHAGLGASAKVATVAVSEHHDDSILLQQLTRAPRCPYTLPSTGTSTQALVLRVSDCCRPPCRHRIEEAHQRGGTLFSRVGIAFRRQCARPAGCGYPWLQAWLGFPNYLPRTDIAF